MRLMHIRKLLSIEWDTLSGVAAAAVAMILSFFDLVSPTTVRAILLLIVALILLRELRRDSRETQYAEHLDIMRQDVHALVEKSSDGGISLVTPTALLHEFQDFSAHLRGTVTWYNACCGMFSRPEAFQSTLAHLIDNPEIHAIQMLCDRREQTAWESHVAEHVRQRGMAEKVRTPLWGDLATSLSFLIGARRGDNRYQALIAIMEEPFSNCGGLLRVPRYLLRVQNGSALLAEMSDVIRMTMTEFSQAGSRRGQRVGGGRLDEGRATGETKAGGAGVPPRSLRSHDSGS